MSPSHIEITMDEATNPELEGVSQAIDRGTNVEMEFMVENLPARVSEKIVLKTYVS